MRVENANRICFSVNAKIVKYFIHLWCFMKIISFNLSWPKIIEITNQDRLKKEPTALYFLLLFL